MSKNEKEIELERAVIDEVGGSDPKWKTWILVLLCLEVVYIALEFGFNAALLNVASGVFPDPQSLDDIEMAGRLLSGVGFGFLVYGIVGMKYKGRVCRPKKQAVMLLTIMPFAIAFMYTAQEVLIEKLIVEKASDNDRFAATYLNMVRPAIRNGTLILEDVPITQETSDRPENKAFLAIAGMLMASNEKVVDRIPREIENIVGAMVHREALESQNEAYKAYQEVDEQVVGLYEEYRQGLASMPEKIDKAMEEVRKSEFYRKLDTELADAYSKYANGAKEVYKALGSKTYFKPYYVASACNPHKTNYRESACRASIKKNGQAYYEMTGSRLNVLKFCDIRVMNHGKCDWSAERVGRLVYGDLTPEKRRSAPIPLNVDGIPLGLNKRQFYQDRGFAASFGTQRHNGIRLRAEDLVLDGAGVPNAEASVRKALVKSMKEDFVYAANEPFRSGDDDIEYGMQKYQFFRTDSVQSAYRSVLGKDSAEIIIEPEMKGSEFLEKVLLPMSWKTVAARLEGIPKSPEEMVQNESMNVQGEDAVRAMVVPPIALVLSLFFSLFTLSKVFHHLAAIQFIRHPKSFPLKKVKAAITGSFLVVVVSFPFLLPENPMVKTGIVEAATGKVDSDAAPSKLVTVAMDWMIRAEPAIYPIANDFIGLPVTPFKKYHDADAQSIGLDDVAKLDTLKLVSSLSVTEVQRRLNALGYKAGPVDGFMGSKTMDALKQFQKSRGLSITGVIDAETSMALLKN